MEKVDKEHIMEIIKNNLEIECIVKNDYTNYFEIVVTLKLNEKIISESSYGFSTGD
jgi:hypothetical protein